MFDIFGGFNGNKLKAQLKMAVSRFQIASNKKTALVKQDMRKVAVLLSEDPPKEEKARIKAEALIREDNMIEAYDILSLECELLSERIKLLEFSKECPADLVSCVSTLIYAAPRLDIPELGQARKMFRAKYGKKFEEAALNNTNGVLNERVVTKLSIQPPAAYLVQTYLEKTCDKHEVDWKPTIQLTAAQMCEPMAPPSGFSVAVGQGTGLGPVPVNTGLTATDIDVNYSKPDDTSSWVTSNGGTSVPPEVMATPIMPNAPSPSAPGNDFEEADIFIPAAPGHSSTTASDQPMPPPSNGGKGDDDDDKNRKPPASGGGGGGSYADLAARFDDLKGL